MKTKTPQCEDCGDKGWLMVSSPHGQVEHSIERCDACEKCKSDLAAATAFFKSAAAADYQLKNIVIQRAPVQEGRRYTLHEPGSDDKTVKVLAIADDTAIVEDVRVEFLGRGVGSRLNVRTNQLQPIL